MTTEVQEKFKREVRFKKGYDHRNSTDPEKKRYGCHGMEIWFLLKGKCGTVHFLLSTMWLPTLKHHEQPTFGPRGANVGYHWKKRFPWMNKKDYPHPNDEKCDYINGKDAWYDCSYSAGSEVFQLFLTEGEEAMWKDLEKRYYYQRDDKNE